LNESENIYMEKNMIKLASISLSIVLGLSAAYVQAKLPAPAPLTDEQKAKVEEAKAKAAESAKKEAELLIKYQDRATANYLAKRSGNSVTGSSALPQDKAPQSLGDPIKKP
jgi:hypothetical protein